VIQKQTVNTTLAWVIRPTLCTATNFIFDSKLAVHNILQYYFVLGKKMNSPDQFPVIQDLLA
jgi:hypothetical protein